ncbi:MAG: ABC transporter ATP-binding protein [Candidatus Bipolaricaulia bacterium]
MLRVQALEAGYGPMQVLWGPTLEVRPGSITALLGPNGAGKSTALKTILGTVKPWRGQVTYNGQDVTHVPPHRKVAMGIVLVPEGRHLFATMTVHENLIMGAYQQQRFPRESLELVYALFPILKERAHQRAGTLSGGEQQMLTIARGLMARPHLMMLDEPSQGLAPKLVAEVFATIERLRREIDLTILLVEQNVEYALTISDYAYIMHEGRIKAEGSAQEIRQSQIREVYLGL